VLVTGVSLGCSRPQRVFGILHSLFVEEGHKEDRQLYRAKSTDNPYLPADFIDGMRENYPEALLQSYINGEFCNLTQASVYPEFDRELNKSDIDAPTENDVCWLGVDFNVDRCWVSCMVAAL